MSCNNQYLLAHMLRTSGVMSGEWSMYLMSSDFQLSCEKMITSEMLAPTCIISKNDFAVSIDEANVCVELAQTEVRFPGVAHRWKEVNKIVLMTPLNLAAAILSKDMIHQMFRSHNANEADLVLRPGADRAIWGF